MKLLASAALLLSMASTGLAATTGKKVGANQEMKLNGKKARNLVKASRKLDQNDNNNNNNQDEWSFLMNYKAKFVMCAAGEKFMGEGEYEYSSIVYRLCPESFEEPEKESKRSAFGCSDDEKYGDYVVGINTYVEAYGEWMEEQWNNNQNNNGRKLNDEFDLREYAECAEADMDMDDEGRKNRKLNQEMQFFIGPACTEEGDDIKLEFFSNEGCTYVAESPYTYYELTGRNLPYYDGGLAKQGFTSCQEYDDGNYDTSEFCMRLYENAGKCEANNQYYCETIEELEAEMKAAEAPSKAGKVFLIIILILLFCGLGYWAFKLYQKKKAAEGGEGEGSGPFNQLC